MDPVSPTQISPKTQRLIDQWRRWTVGGSTPLPVFIAETTGSMLRVCTHKILDFEERKRKKKLTTK